MKPAARGTFLRPGQGLETALSEVAAVHPSMTPRLAKMGIETVRQLLYHFPRRHIDFSRTDPVSALVPGQDHTIVGTVWEAKEVRVGAGGRRRAAQAVVGDETGNVRIVWWNQPYVARTLKRGSRIAVSGRVGVFRGRPGFDNPEYELAGDGDQVHTGRLVPVYPLTEGLTSRRVRGLLKEAIDGAAPPARRLRSGGETPAAPDAAHP